MLTHKKRKKKDVTEMKERNTEDDSEQVVEGMGKKNAVAGIERISAITRLSMDSDGEPRINL